METKEFLIILLLIWGASTLYVLNWHRKEKDLDFGVIFIAVLLGPILAIFIKDSEKELKKQREERETNDRHRRWFQTMGLINRNTIPDYGRTIPPPPPISRQRINQEEVRSEWRRQNGISKLKDFKFLQK